MLFFFFNDTATTEIYTLSLHDALPISDTEVLAHLIARSDEPELEDAVRDALRRVQGAYGIAVIDAQRSEEHTSELQSRQYLVCRLLLEKKHTHTPILI